MIKKNNFFKNFFINSKNYSQNIKKTKNVFNAFKKDFNNSEIPFLDSYTRDYKLDFSNKTFEEYTCITNVRNVEAEALIRVTDPTRRRRRG